MHIVFCLCMCYIVASFFILFFCSQRAAKKLLLADAFTLSKKKGDGFSVYITSYKLSLSLIRHSAMHLWHELAIAINPSINMRF